jgi:hypothetical protein
MTKTINEIWEGLAFTTNPNKLYKKAKDEGINITQKETKEFINKQKSTQLLSAGKKQKYFNSVIAPKAGSNLMIDLMIYNRYKFKQYDIILNCIDIHSRYGYGLPLTNKNQDTIIEAC